ncbi:MAG TPA: DUF1622 domain-containing protein [Ktedonobacteraceae bacterium]|nr:DUF1622 domain-containing protein [Ktedonobacteraceae bacterium]
MDFKRVLDLFGIGFELAGVAVLVIGVLQALVTYLIAFFRQRDAPIAFHDLRQKVGKSILLGLELLVAADIIRSVAIDPTFASVGVLGLIVAVRTFLSWSLEVEINEKWPWQTLYGLKHAPTDQEDL